MIPIQVVIKAVEGGYAGHTRYKHHMDDETWQKQLPLVARSLLKEMTEEGIALDPDFWQALGKALGWSPQENYKFADRPDLAHLTYGQIQEQRPFAHAHAFYDLILTGGPTDEFWKGILK